MSAPEFLWIVKESAYGTPMASPVAGTDSIYIRLTDSNSFSMVADPVFVETPYGGGLDICADVQADHYDVKGNLSTLLYPSQAALLLGWAMTQVNAGQTLPWVTTEPAQDLPSCSIYHGIRRRDGTIKRHLYPGCKVTDWAVECSRQSPRATLKLGLIGQKEVGNSIDGSSDPSAGTFPEPADSAYPTGPYLFSHSGGNLVVGSALTQYASVSVKGTNKLDPRFFESHWLSTCGFKGRSATLDADVLLKASPDLRGALIALTNEAVSLKFSDGVTGHIATQLQFNVKNYIMKCPYDLALGKEFFQKLSVKNRYDASAGQDLGVVITTNP